jgi:hypothetical protein
MGGSSVNAVPHPKWARLRAELVSDVKHGAPIEYIELGPDEALRWIAQEDGDDIVEVLVDSITGLDDKRNRALEALLSELMMDVTADRLIDLRNFVRTIICDRCSERARDLVEDDLS